MRVDQYFPEADKTVNIFTYYASNVRQEMPLELLTLLSYLITNGQGCGTKLFIFR